MGCLMGGKAPKAPKLESFKMPEYADTTARYLGQQDQFGKLSSFNNQANSIYQNQLTQTTPGLFPALERASRNAQSMVAGMLPADLAQRVSRMAGYSALQGGYGGGSSMGGNLQARDFGLSSLDLMNQGYGMLPGLQNMSNAANPFQLQSQLFSIGNTRNEDMNQSMMNFDIRQQQQMLDYQDAIKNRKPGMLGTGMSVVGGVVGGYFGGPMGASAGMQAGGQLGGAIQGASGGNPDYYGSGMLNQAGGMMMGMGSKSNTWESMFKPQTTGVPQTPFVPQQYNVPQFNGGYNSYSGFNNMNGGYSNAPGTNYNPYAFNR